MPNTNASAKVNAEIRRRLKQMEELEANGAQQFVAKLDELRRLIVMAIVEEREITAYTSSQLKSRIAELVERFRPALEAQLTENQRRLFVKGIQMIDATLKTADLVVAVPYLSEQLLEQARNFGAELITGITDDARRRVATEINLAVMGQKPLTDVVKAIGRNLDSPSVFGSIATRALAIYKTEVNRMSNLASVERMKQVRGQVPDLEKEWLHSHQGIPRPGHLLLDGTRVAVLDTFKLVGKNGTVYMVAGPHDPVLPAGEVVNCRCHAIPVVTRLENAA